MSIIRVKENNFLISAKDEYYTRYRLKKILGIVEDIELPINEDIILSLTYYFFPEIKKIFVYLLSSCIKAPNEVREQFKQLRTFYDNKMLYRKQYSYIKKLFANNNVFKNFKKQIEKDLCLKETGVKRFINYVFIPFATGKLNSFIYINEKDFYMNFQFIFNYIELMQNTKRASFKSDEHLIMQLNIAGFDSYHIVHTLPLTDERGLDDILFIMNEILPKKLETSTFMQALIKYIIQFNYVTFYNTKAMSKKERFKFFYDSIYEKFDESDILEHLLDLNFGQHN